LVVLLLQRVVVEEVVLEATLLLLLLEDNQAHQVVGLVKLIVVHHLNILEQEYVVKVFPVEEVYGQQVVPVTPVQEQVVEQLQ
tara:strand:- start:50 stop:298 length:249 start_codon:yes stop_codon:yes gene_type:complete